MATRSLPRRLLRWIAQAILIFFIGSILIVAIYRFVPPPVTVTMLANAGGGRGITKDWMALDTMSPAMPRAAIAAEDGNFCTHHGFDFNAI